MMWDAAPGKAVPLWLPRMPWHRGVMRLTTGWCFKVFLPKSHELSKCCGLYSTNQIAANGELHCVKTPFDKAVRLVPRQHPPRGETVFVHPCARIITPSVQNLFHVLVGEREASLSTTKSLYHAGCSALPTTASSLDSTSAGSAGCSALPGTAGCAALPTTASSFDTTSAGSAGCAAFFAAGSTEGGCRLKSPSCCSTDAGLPSEHRVVHAGSVAETPLLLTLSRRRALLFLSRGTAGCCTACIVDALYLCCSTDAGQTGSHRELHCSAHSLVISS